MIKAAILAVVCLGLSVPAAAVGLYGGDPISISPEHLELEFCLAAQEKGFLPADKSLCAAQYEQRMMQQRTLSPASDPKLLPLPGYDALIRR